LARFEKLKEKLWKLVPAGGDLHGVSVSGLHFSSVTLWEAFLAEFGQPSKFYDLHAGGSVPLWVGDLTWQGMRITIFGPAGWKPNHSTHVCDFHCHDGLHCMPSGHEAPPKPNPQTFPGIACRCGHDLNRHQTNNCNMCGCLSYFGVNTCNALVPSLPHVCAAHCLNCTCSACSRLERLKKPLWERPEDIPECKLPCPQCGGVMIAFVQIATDEIVPEMWDCRVCMTRYHFTKEEEDNPKLLAPQDGINRASLSDMK